MKKDNQTFNRKAALRLAALREVARPVVMETHGGAGKLYQACYSEIEAGVVFEKHPDKTSLLSRQRPTWSVYEADCVRALAAGAGAHLPVNFLDLDPYGSPWDVLDAYFTSDRPRLNILVIVVNDGMRNKLKLGCAWQVKQLSEIVSRYGNNLYQKYLGVCEELLNHKAAQSGYSLRRFTGYYCGFQGNMTHYAATLVKEGAEN